MFSYLDICTISTYVSLYKVYEYTQALIVIHLAPQVVTYMQQKCIGKEI